MGQKKGMFLYHFSRNFILKMSGFGDDYLLLIDISLGDIGHLMEIEVGASS